MVVGRLYDISHDLFAIERLWSKVTVFDEVETDTGRAMTLKRLKKLRDDVNVVITELEQETEEEAWLS